MAAQAGFDVRDGYSCLGRAQRPAKRARSVPLYEDQPSFLDRRADSSGDIANVKLRVGPARTAEPDRRQLRHAVIRWLEVGVLSGEDEPRADAAKEERLG